MDKIKPLIGISTNFLEIVEKPFSDHQRIYVNSGYIDAIIKAGGIPLLLPITADEETIDRLVALVDGVLLSGGQDVHPSNYNEDNHPLLGTTSKERDAYEMRIIQNAYQAKKPILGICRGLQLINVAFGGTLYQDLSQQEDVCNSKHRQDIVRDAVLHDIDVIPETELHRIFGKTKLVTNSFHHQAVKDLAPGFAICAKSEDGVVESICRSGSPWILGVQWHPEVMIDAHPEMKHLFVTFINKAGNT